MCDVKDCGRGMQRETGECKEIVTGGISSEILRQSPRCITQCPHIPRPATTHPGDSERSLIEKFLEQVSTPVIQTADCLHDPCIIINTLYTINFLLSYLFAYLID